jgi:hypothetical protein
VKIPTKSLELMLLGWQDHHNTGFKVTFAITPEDEDYFRGATAAKGKIAGQRYACVLVEIGPNEEPVETPVPLPEPPKPETVAMRAARERAEDASRFTKQDDGSFSRTVVDGLEAAENTKHVVKHSFPQGLCGLAVKWGSDPHFHGWLEDQFTDLWNFDQELDDVERAREVVNHNCGVDSRKSLDTQPEAGELFRKHFLEPYSAARKKDGIDE